MHVMVLGAGVTGVSTAWYLQQAGFEVSVVDRQPGAGLETSFANGGQISISHPEPWANPAAPWLVLRWLGRDDAPLKFRPTLDPAQWRWALAFLRECLPARSRRNTAAIAALAVHSAQCLARLREASGLEYEQRTRGILHLFNTAAEFAHAPQRVAQLAQLGIEASVCSAAQCVAIEPALAARQPALAGGMHAAGDESGNAHLFTQALAARLEQAGARFYWNTRIQSLRRTGAQIEAIEVIDSTGTTASLRADAYVVCLGSYGTRLLAALGLRVPIYPVKGYSITAPIACAERAPELSLTDESRRIVCSRLGNHLRVAGTAELNGFDTGLRPERIRPLTEWARLNFPGAIDETRVSAWAGLRPATPGNLPLIGKTPWPNLWLNTGHGTLGWTLACGSAAAIADLMRGQRPAISFPFRD
ncbi:MAG: D-amino acid dehydrogenase [Thauera sp.]|jgi:D-amino-acid dehydrogenase|nr:D-amino acid dehydrogenase [Thauera sp.]